MVARLLMLAGAPKELTELEVAMGYERAHAEFASYSHCLPVVAFGTPDTRWVTTRDNLTEEVETPGLVTALVVALRERYGLLGAL